MFRFLGACGLLVALTPDSIRQAKSYDLCSMLSTILWGHATGAVKTAAIDPRYSSVVGEFVQDQRVAELMSKVAKRVPGLFGTSFSLQEETRLAQRETLVSIIQFAITFHNFMAKYAPRFSEKLRWCMPAQVLGYQFSKLSSEMPSIADNLTKWLKTSKGAN